MEGHGHTVGKEELFEKVGPGTFVEEGNLAPAHLGLTTSTGPGAKRAACGRRTGNFGPAPVCRLACWLRPCPWAGALRGTLMLVWRELCAAEACLDARVFDRQSAKPEVRPKLARTTLP